MPLPKSMIEAELPARAQQGDENALAALIARMMPAIRKGAADCTAPGLDFDDAVQEGLIGLFRFDLVAWIFGGSTTIGSRIVYGLVGLAALWCIGLLFRPREEGIA